MKEMRLTGFDTILLDNEEFSVDEFFEKFHNNLGNDYAIYYEEDKNRFKVIFNGVGYFLKLGNMAMEDYNIGIYTSFTSQLNKIIKRTKEMEKINNNEEELRLERERIICDAVENGIIPNDKARRVYLDYLKDKRKFSFSKIKSYFLNLIGDLRASHYMVNKWVFDTHIWPFKYMVNDLEYFVMTLISSIVILFVVSVYLVWMESAFGLGEDYLEVLFLLLLPQTTYSVPMTKFLGFQVKLRFNRLINYGKNKRLTNHKIKQLTEELEKGSIEDKSFNTFDKILSEPVEEQDKSYEDEIMGYLEEKILKRLEYINKKDRDLLAAEVEKIAEEYKARMDAIRKQELDVGDELKLDVDNYFSIKQDIWGKIGLLEQKMFAIRKNDIETDLFAGEYSRLMTSIKKCSNAGNTVVDVRRRRVRRKSKH